MSILQVTLVKTLYLRCVSGFSQFSWKAYTSCTNAWCNLTSLTSRWVAYTVPKIPRYICLCVS